MPRHGENIHKRNDGRWEGRYISQYPSDKPKYISVYGKSYSDVKSKMKTEKSRVHPMGFYPEQLELLVTFCFLLQN